ncbi:TonB-dependent receptor [Kineobactrum salinum]|uniref:TonB-dependent receptor n=1 Tax=Kineobactrum salinum TaxID=2708301 RepID=A0A6C0TXK9_9GAMM|nr:TonB-dependent receptor [Kineobactrum salinum]QIB64139.1 TonB-dependent receptor [Kineobactrum salinum]
MVGNKMKSVDLRVITVGVALALAQQVHGQALEEVTVTAQKREQSLQDVGISVSALSSDRITEYGLSSAIDLINKVPSLDNYSPYGPGSSANITIRGIGLNDFGEGHEAPVTAYVDEFYLVPVPAVDFSLYDLDRVEVLRGPQGTLFGRNSTGGLVHFVTKRPTRETSGFLSLGVAEYGEFKGEGAISGALSETVSGRLSFLSHHSDGYIDNRNPDIDDGGQAGTNAVRAQLLFEPSEDLSIWVKASHADISKIHTHYEQQPMVVDPATGLYSSNPGGTDGAGYNQNNFNAGDRNATFTSVPNEMEQSGSHLLVKIDKYFDGFSLTSTTGYMDMERELSEDCDASPNDICSSNFPYETDWLTQEFRFSGEGGSLTWTAGLYYLYQDAKNSPSATFNVPVSGPAAVDPDTRLYNGDFLPISLAANWEQETTSYSVFGQIEYDLSSSLTLIAGARYGRDEKEFTDRDNATLRSCPGFALPTNCFLAPQGTGSANPYSGDYAENLLSWKLGLDYRLQDDVLLYLSVSQGSKAGGFNNGFYSSAAAADQSLIPYEDETNLAYEVGVKSSWLDNRVRTNVAAFYYDYTDFQTFQWQGVGGLIANNDASASGAEVEFEAYLTQSLDAQLGLSYLDTTIEDLEGPATGYVADREMASAPGVTANGSLGYSMVLRNGIDAKLLWDWNYVSERYTNNFNDPTSEMESYFKHNLSLVLNWGERWTATAYVRNLSDKQNENKVFVFSDLGYRQVIHAQPRTVGASLRYEF